MARNSEKAMAMLNRWTTMKMAITKGLPPRRPRKTEESQSISECEHWRNQIIRECSKKISEIQNAGLGEHRIRELNDELNRLLREKSRWEIRIKELGGPDYGASAPKMLDAMGSALVGHDGYKYFGAAKDLPGVRELFEQDRASAPMRRTRAEMSKHLKPDYYGWRDEERIELLEEETEQEATLRSGLESEWQARLLMRQQDVT